MTSLVVDTIVSADRSGNSWPMRVLAGGKEWILKSHGAAQGSGTLVAELACATLARRLGLNTPSHVFLELAEGTPSLDKNDELADHISRSVGCNLGVEILANVRDYTEADNAIVDDRTKAMILWLDGLIQNADRTPSNPNMVMSGDVLWLIDFGAALPFQYSQTRITERMPMQAGTYLDHHIFRTSGFNQQWAAYDEEFATLITRDVLDGALADVPKQWLLRQREVYSAFLWKRTKWPRAFTMLLDEVEPRKRERPDWLRPFSRNT